LLDGIVHLFYLRLLLPILCHPCCLHDIKQWICAIRDRKMSKSDYYVTLCNIFVFILWHVFDNSTFFSSRQNSVSKNKNIVANLLNVDKDKKLLSEINSCIQFVWNAFQVL
jgi:hypothetical protein